MKILIIEDEKEIRDLLRRGLEGECFAVDEAENGEEGIALALQNDYDLIILDNIMPKKNGLEVCKEIRGNNKSVPIIMLSIKSEVTTKTNLLNAGVDDYITKPFSFDELIARVRALLRRPKELESEIMKVGDLELDVKNHIVKRGDKDIYLARKEFMLLSYLMKNKGVVVTRSMMMEHVWDMNADPFSNTIESHILNLRKKIDEKGKDKIICTVPGRGYRVG